MIVEDLSLLDTEFNGLVSSTKSRQDLFVEDRMVYFKLLFPLVISIIHDLFSIRHQLEQKGATNGASQDNEYST